MSPGAARLVLAAIVLSLSTPVLGAVQSWTVPGVAKAPGQNGTSFVSDLVVMNGGSVSTTVTFSFVPAGLTSQDYVLGAGASLTVRDVVASAFGAGQAVGAVILTADQPLVVRGRTYNTASSGTYGEALPVVPDSRFLAAGDRADSLWISQDAQADRGYRTNIAVVFPDPAGGAATVTLYDAAGNLRGQQDFSLDAAGFQQLGVGKIVAGGLAIGRAEINVTSGRASGYAVVVDNVTGDGSLFPFEELPAGRQDVVVSGVATTAGALGTFWRTDARLYNPSARDTAVTVRFHAAGTSNTSPQTTTVTVPAGQILDVVDVLGTLLSLPVGSSGALRFQSDTPVAVLCRTSNVDPTGVRPGTYGSQQQAVPLMSYLTSADAGAVVTGVKQNGAFRTNVGLAAGANGAAYTLTLRSADGSVAATVPGSLGVFGWTQPNIGVLFSGTSIPDDAQLTVKVTAGSLDVFDSSIDAGSGDSVVTRIAPLPVEIPSSASIGTAGGSVRSVDGRLTLKIPAGALSVTTSLSIGETANGAPQGLGSGYTVSPGSLSFAKPALLVFAYGTSDTDGSAPGSLGLAFQSGENWYVATGGSADTVARTVTVPIPLTTPAISVRAATAGTKQVDAAPQAWSPYTAYVMIPKKAAVLQGKKVRFEVVYTGPSSSETGQTVPAPRIVPSFANPDLLYNWYANGVLLGNNVEGYLTEMGPDAWYTAPSCHPAGNPVRVAVGIIDPENPISPGVSTVRWPQSKVRVVPPEWKITFENGYGANCRAGLSFNYLFSYTNTMSFSVNEGLQLVSDLLPSSPVSHIEPWEWCQPSPSCTLTMDPPDAGVIQSVAGAFNVSTDKMLVQIGVRSTGAPGVTLSCPGGSPLVYPRQPGLSATWLVDAPVTSSGYHEDYSIEVMGMFRSIDIMTVRPVLNRCP
ncbi:MAG: hypothetical protein ACHQPI_01500 [Thermoanaerobaculia bacterium]